MQYRVFFFASAISFSFPLLASEAPTYAPPASWVVPSPALRADAPSSRPWLLADRQVLIEPGKASVFVDNAIRIATAEDLQNWRDMTFEWQPDREDLIVHSIAIIRNGKTIDLLGQGLKLNVLQREKSIEQRALDGLLTATAPIADLRIGDTVRFSTTLVANQTVHGRNGEITLDLAAEPSEIAAGSVRVLWPKDLPVRWKAKGKGVVPKESVLGAYRLVSQTYPVTKQDEMPEDSPLRFRRMPVLEFTTFQSWADVSRLLAPLYATKGLVRENGPLAAEISRIAGSTTDPKKRAEAALRLVQKEVRYLYRGMENGNYVPQTPEETWSTRYGDCKAKTLLLLAMLEKLGIEARPALVHASLGDLLPDRLPALGAFDHVIVEARIEGTSYWLDGTATGTHIEDLADVPPLGFALPLSPAGDELTAFPVRQPARPHIAVSLHFDQSAGTVFPPLFDLALTVRGAQAAAILTIKAQASPEQLREFATATVQPFVNDGVAIESSIDVDEAAGLVHFRAKGLGNLFWTRTDDRPFVPVPNIIARFEFDSDRARPSWREIPIFLGRRELVTSRTSITLPPAAGFTLEGPPLLDRDIAGFAIRRNARLTGNRLDDDEQIWAKGIELQASDLPAARAASVALGKNALRLRAPAGYPDRIAEMALARKEKRLGPLLAAYQKAIDGQPDEAHIVRNRALFQLVSFDFKSAIADYSAAIALEPTADSYLSRAKAKALLGDHAGALADLVEALALDPALETANEEKVRQLTALNRFEDALKMADSQLAEAQDKRDWTIEKAAVLAAAGRAEEGAGLLTAALADWPNDTKLLNGLCWLRGTRRIQLDVALADCTRAVELSTDGAAPLDSRAMVHFRLGRMQEARADLEAALKLKPSKAQLLFMRGVLRGLEKDKAGAAADLALARLQVPGIDKDYAKFGIAADQ